MVPTKIAKIDLKITPHLGSGAKVILDIYFTITINLYHRSPIHSCIMVADLVNAEQCGIPWIWSPVMFLPWQEIKE